MSAATANAFVLVATGLVFVVLVAGLVNMVRGGSSSTSQRLMRWRVGLQFVAILVVMIVLYFRGVTALVVLNRIYTRTGDDGTTALGSGERRRKSDTRIAAYGTVDECNAAIGIARLSAAAESPRLDAMLGRIQNDLFDLGADLATPPAGGEAEGARLRVVQAQVDRLEREIDDLNVELQPLRSFVLPGGTPAAAALHLARTVCRRAERLMVDLRVEQGEAVGDAALGYANRLSDFLFVASRHCNHLKGGDVLWVPGQNR